MEEGGERYTDAAEAIRKGESDKVVSATIKDLLEAREDGALAVSLVLQKFHERHHARGEWQATLGSHAVDHLWPGPDKPPETDKLRELLTNYQTDETFEGAGVRQRSDRHLQAVRQAAVGAHPKPNLFEEWKAKTRSDLPPMTEEDKSFYDITQPLNVLTPAELGGKTETQVLQNMWKYAPDVSQKFGMPAVPKVYGWDQKRGDKVKQGKRSYVNRLAGGSSILPATSMILQTSKPSEGEIVIKTASVITMEPGAKIEAVERVGVHVTDEGGLAFRKERGEPVIALDAGTKADPTEEDAEIQRLRKKLEDAGVDPDA